MFWKVEKTRVEKVFRGSGWFKILFEVAEKLLDDRILGIIFDDVWKFLFSFFKCMMRKLPRNTRYLSQFEANLMRSLLKDIDYWCSI
jgi:hypothetical protein